METNKLFILIIVISSLLGFFLGIYNNKINYPNESNTNEKKPKEINTEKKSDEKKLEEKTDEKKVTDKNIINKDNDEEEEENINDIDPLSINKTIIAVAYATDNKYIYIQQ